MSLLVHQGTLLSLVARSPALDTLKAMSQVAFIMEVNFASSSSVGGLLDFLTHFFIAFGCHGLFTQLNFESKFDTKSHIFPNILYFYIMSLCE